MKQEDKQLVLKDLCGRLPYGVIVKDRNGIHKLTVGNTEFTDLFYSNKCNIKPYLRPMSSMTEEERKEYEGFIIHRKHVNAQGQEWDIDCFSFGSVPRLISWLNAHHFDYHGLIPMGLALEASEGMYK